MLTEEQEDITCFLVVDALLLEKEEICSTSRTAIIKFLDSSVCYTWQQTLPVRCGPTELSEHHLSKAQTIKVHSTEDEYKLKDR